MHFLSTTLRRLLVLAGLGLAWSAATADPIEIDALTDDLTFNSAVPAVKPPGLEMNNGAFLHGGLVGVDTGRQELSWRVDGASAPLTFPMPQVRQVTFAPELERGTRPRSLVKFVGGDWVAAEVEGLKGDDLQLTLADGVLVSAPRSKVEWIYFSHHGTPECYDGPTSFDGWEADENWTYDEGVLRANGGAMLSRNFTSLPDQVEYVLELEHSAAAADFSMTIQSTVVGSRAVSGGIRFIIQRDRLTIVSQLGNTMQSETVPLDEAMLGNAHGMRLGPQLRLHIFEDCPTGNIVVYLGDRLVREISVTRIPEGGNRGAFTFQTLAWQPGAELSISRFCVRPWDGHRPDEDDLAKPPARDRIGIFRGARYEGALVGLSPRGARIATAKGTADITCEPSALIRLAGAAPSRPAPPPAAHLHLGHGGEIDAQSVVAQTGRALVLQTSFNQHLQLPLGLLKRIRFFGLPWETTQPSDTLYFKNGDRLDGLLESANGQSVVQWRAALADAPVDIASRVLMGMRLAPRDTGAAAAAPQVRALAELRNGDSLPGGLLSLSKDSLVLATSAAGSVTFPREAVKKLYFGDEDSLPVLDGASFPDFWMRGPVFDRDYYAGGVLPKQAERWRRADFPWRYLDGTFTYQGQNSGIWRALGGSFIGCYFDAMPQLVEFSFDVASERGSLFLSAQLFSLTPSRPGYLLELDPEGLSVFDVSPGQAGQVMAQRHTPFAGKLATGVWKRHLRIFADRPEGKLAVMVDGVLMGQFSRKGAGVHFPLGRTLTLAPQMNMPCRVSNLWIGPWNGQLPENSAAHEPRAVLLENGDQAEGGVESATATEAHFGSDLGSLEMPLSRISTINFGGESVKAPVGVRLRFAGGGMLTAADWSVENGQVRCRTESAGDLQFPLGALQEIDLANGAPEE